MRKVLATLIILMLLFNIVTPPKETYAFAPAIIIPIASSGAVEALAGALIATGVCIATKEAGEYAAQWLFDTAPIVANEIIQAASSAINGAMEISSTTWESLRTWSQEKFTTTETEATVSAEVITMPADLTLAGKGPIYHFVDIDAALADGPLIITAPWIAYQAKSGTYAGYIWEYKYIYEEGYCKIYHRKFRNNGDILANDWTYVTKQGFYPTDGSISFMVETNGTTASVSVVWPNGTDSSLKSEGANLVDITFGETITYTGADVLSNPTWDIENVEGKRMVYYPTNVQDLVNKSYLDVIDPAISQSTDTSLLDAINNFFDFSTPINWEPLQVSGALFTNKFPFSLPWDLLHSFQVWQVPEEEVIFNIAVPDTQYMKGMVFNVNFDWFKDFIPIVKTIELLLFDVALIMTTRRLLGGAT